MSSFYLILALVFSLLIAIIALANNDTVTVNYIFGRHDVSLILLILGSAFGGALVMGMISLFRAIRSAFAFREMRHKHEALEKKVKEIEEERIFLEAKLNSFLSDSEESELAGGQFVPDEDAVASTGDSTLSDQSALEDATSLDESDNNGVE